MGDLRSTTLTEGGARMIKMWRLAIPAYFGRFGQARAPMVALVVKSVAAIVAMAIILRMLSLG